MGKAYVYGDNINTDVIFPGKYTYTISDRAEMAKYALEDLDPAFVSTVQPGDVVVAGRNFGCGSSREQAVICLVELGVAAVVAESFARIYFRNAINQGLPVITLADAPALIPPGAEVSLDLASGKLTATGSEHRFAPYSAEVKAILDAGGLVEHTKAKLNL